MTDHGDQLREAFRTHEDQIPDAAAVYARVKDLSRTYKRRRRGCQAAGGAVLGAGLIAGAFQLPSLLPASQSSNAAALAPAAAPPPAVLPSPTPSATASPAPVSTKTALDRQYDAYFAAGYGYEDARKLAKYWKISNDRVGDAKAKAGKLLLQGKDLPDVSGVKPDPESTQGFVESQRVEAFFAAGYDYDDAVELSKLWKTKSPYDAKILGGKKLLAGGELPIQP
ncbi:hypothetical protein [Actinoplanes sp. TFC3]|uniref:hypothetical protein n=1 Tax=Actinoplanes sp. TFC3 TaxID=1710355 RepID=UPI00083523A8|nr:hypothetical protein [Actinoplanes sp. TFC3]